MTEPKPSYREVVDALSAAGLCGDVPANDSPADAQIDIPLILGSDGADCGDEIRWDNHNKLWFFSWFSGSWACLPEQLDEVRPEVRAALAPLFTGAYKAQGY